jgi:hypothetical protein
MALEDPFHMVPLKTGEYYLQFLEEIDAGDHDVSEWEANFLNDMLTTRPRFLSAKQQAIVQRMAKRYLHTEVE